jgi:hypothetical protein
VITIRIRDHHARFSIAIDRITTPLQLRRGRADKTFVSIFDKRPHFVLDT